MKLEKLVETANHNHVCYDLLEEAFRAATMCAKRYERWMARTSGSCWINGKPITVTDSTEELYEKTVHWAERTISAMEKLRKEFDLRYDRFYDFSDSGEKVELALTFELEMSEICYKSACSR